MEDFRKLIEMFKTNPKKALFYLIVFIVFCLASYFGLVGCQAYYKVHVDSLDNFTKEIYLQGNK